MDPGDQDQPYPDLDLDELIGLTSEAAAEAARATGVERIRILEIVNGTIPGPMDMGLSPNRLDLVHEQGRVVYAMFPTRRHAGIWPDRPDAHEWPTG